MYLVKMEFSFRSEKFEPTSIKETSRNMKMSRRDFPKEVFKVIEKIGDELTKEIIKNGGPIMQYVAVDGESLESAAKSPHIEVSWY
jgi:hypothetical protein